MATRVRNFSRAHPSADANYVAVLSRLEERITRARPAVSSSSPPPSGNRSLVHVTLHHCPILRHTKAALYHWDLALRTRHRRPVANDTRNF